MKSEQLHLQNRFNTMKIQLVYSLLLLFPVLSIGQNINEQYDKWAVTEDVINITGIDLSPNGKEVALVGGKMDAIYLYDHVNRKLLRKIPMDKDYSGYRVEYSSNGNYLLLQERVTEYYSTKNSRAGGYAVIDLKSDKIIHQYKMINDLKISFDEKYLIVLDNGTLEIKELSSGKTIQKFKPEGATNAVAISPNGEDLAVVQKPNKADIKMLVDRKMNKKTIKAAAKYKFLIAIYDFKTQELKSVVPEFYDNISMLKYTPDGEKLLSFNIAQNSYVNVALPQSNYEPTRESYLGRSTTQPDFQYDFSGNYFGIATVEKFPAINIYHVGSGSITDQYDTQNKIWKSAKLNFFAGTNASFIFTPDGEYAIIAYGNSLIKWRYNQYNPNN